MVNMMRTFLYVFLAGSFVSTTLFGQITRIVPWGDPNNLTDTNSSVIAYHPEPIIFVHGITSSRINWEDVIQNLGVTNHWFDAYHYLRDRFINAKESSSVPAEGYTNTQSGATFVPDKELNQWKDIELPYLHTFNYGRHQYIGPGTNAPWSRTVMLRQSRQSHDPVEWNSWQKPTGDYLTGRKTLRDRIEDSAIGVRAAYQMPNQPTPNVILIGHSLGGLVICDYLQRRNDDLQGQPHVPVRRAITIDSLLWGSPLANLVKGSVHSIDNFTLGVHSRGYGTEGTS